MSKVIRVQYGVDYIVSVVLYDPTGVLIVSNATIAANDFRMNIDGVESPTPVVTASGRNHVFTIPAATMQAQQIVLTWQDSAGPATWLPNNITLETEGNRLAMYPESGQTHYVIKGAVTGAASTTTVIQTNLTPYANEWAGKNMSFSGQQGGIGEEGSVILSNTNTGVITLVTADALAVAPSNLDEFELT